MDVNGIVVPVDAVLEKLDHGDRWRRGSWGGSDSVDGSMCLHQGIRECQVVPGDAFLIEQVATRQGWGTVFNDLESTSFDDVKQRLVEHREVLPGELEAVFGPQWLEVVAFVRRCAVLTPTEQDALRPAPWASDVEAAAVVAVVAVVAVDAVAVAAAAAAYGAVVAVAVDAVDAVAATAAVDAVWRPARALAVRHLIGEHGFTQEHYDVLTGPWREVIGPVHPDD